MKEQVLQCLYQEEYEKALELLQTWKDKEPVYAEWYILKVTVGFYTMEDSETEKVLLEGLRLYPENYELYLNKANLLERQGDAGYAYLCYQYALFLCEREDDQTVIGELRNAFCTRMQASAYELGEGLRKLVEECIFKIGEYNNIFEFLKKLVYTRNKEEGNVWLTEANMLLFILLEIILTEERSGVIQPAQERYPSLAEFKKVFIPLKFYIRRVWFGFLKEEQMELMDAVLKYRVTGDMLAVCIKYTVTKDFLIPTMDACENLCNQREQTKSHAKSLLLYSEMLKTNRISEENKVCSVKKQTIKPTVKIIDVQKDKIISCRESVNEKKLAVIFCTHDSFYMEEVIRYLRYIVLPSGFEMEILPVWNAVSMASGYNFGMKITDAKYKLYIHHDTFLLKEDFLSTLIQYLQGNSQVGLIGVVGTTRLNEEAKWWKCDVKYRRLSLYQDIVMEVLCSYRTEEQEPYEEMACLDGIFIMTAYDVEWREDLFDGWHYYDISQSYEFRKRGYHVHAYNADHALLLHETTAKKDPENRLEYYRNIFIKEYFHLP